MFGFLFCFCFLVWFGFVLFCFALLCFALPCFALFCFASLCLVLFYFNSFCFVSLLFVVFASSCLFRFWFDLAWVFNNPIFYLCHVTCQSNGEPSAFSTPVCHYNDHGSLFPAFTCQYKGCCRVLLLLLFSFSWCCFCSAYQGSVAKWSDLNGGGREQDTQEGENN